MKLSLESLESRTLLNGGILDKTFGTNGLLTSSTLGNIGEFRSLAITSQNRVRLVADGNLVQLLPSGAYDTSFGNGGAIKVFDTFHGVPEVFGALDGADRSVLTVVGNGAVHPTVNVKRYTAAGALDATFGDNGTSAAVVLPATATNSAYAFQQIRVMSDNSILVLSTREPLVHLRADGSADTGFGGSGTGVAMLPANFFGRDAIGLADGSYLVSGEQVVAGFGTPGVVKLTSSGAIDPTFNGGTGIASIPEGYRGDNGNLRLLARSDGKFYLLTGWGTDSIAMLFNNNGTRDTNFADSGIYTRNFASFLDVALDGVVLPDNSLVMEAFAWYSPTATNQSDTLLAHISADGSADATFGANGLAKLNATPSDLPQAVALSPDNELFVISSSTTSTSTNPAYGILARFSGATVTPPDATLINGVLAVETGDGSDSIVLSLDSANWSVRVGSRLSLWNAALVSSIVVSSGGGDDSIELQNLSVPITIDGGSGNDHLTVDDPTLTAATLVTTGPASGYLVSTTSTDIHLHFADAETVSLTGDAGGPMVRANSIERENRFAETFNISEVIAPLTPGDLSLTNQQTGDRAALRPDQITQIDSGDGTTSVVILLDPMLPTGLWHLTLAPGVARAADDGTDNVNGAAAEFAYSPGDITGDGVANFFDLVTLAQNYGLPVSGRSKGDLNYDGRVDFDDLVRFAQYFEPFGVGPSSTATAATTTAAKPDRSLSASRPTGAGEIVAMSSPTSARTVRVRGAK